MRKSKLQDGRPMFVFKVEHFVTRIVFTTALCDYFYDKSEEFPDKLSKTKALTILKHQLHVFGNDGAYSDGFFEAATDVAEERERTYGAAKRWVIKNYPYLIEQKDEVR